MKRYILGWIIAMACILSTCLVSCKTTREVEVPVYIETVRTEYINQLYKDSVYIHDSIDRYISGDTVYLYKYRYLYKYLNRVDTICRTDSIEVPVPIKEIQIQEVNKIKWYQSLLMWLGGIAVIVAAFKIGTLIKGKL